MLLWPHQEPEHMSRITGDANDRNQAKPPAPVRQPPLRPDLDSWVGLDVTSEGLKGRFHQLDTPRFAALGAYAAIAFAIYRNADPIAYGAILVVALATLFVHLKGGGNLYAPPSLDSNKDPPKPRGHLDGSGSPRAASRSNRS